VETTALRECKENEMFPHIKKMIEKMKAEGKWQILRVAPGNNRWIICPESQIKIEIEVSAGRMKFVDFSISVDTNQNISNEEETRCKMDISSDTDSDSIEDEAAIHNANNNTLWINKIITIDPHQVLHSYSSSPVVHIADISNATPRLFFERFMPIDFIMSVVISITNRCARECERRWNDLTWVEFMKFI
ncbi:4554_t:CDS:2, partial [Diversispora eburnea]